MASATASKPSQHGFLAGAPSNVEVSHGGDEDLMSFYSTVASSTWRNPGLQRKSPFFDAPGDVVTGYTKNCPHIQSPRAESAEPLMSTYDAINKSTEQILKSSDDPRIITAETEMRGGFASSSASPIKWKDGKFRRHALPPQFLAKRRRADPTEWENGLQGPADYSTSFQTSYVAPHQMEDRCNAGLAGERARPEERRSLSSGWRENNTVREHPWVHPGAPGPQEAETTYRHYVRYPGSAGCRAEEAPMRQSGYTQSAKRLVLGGAAPAPADRLSTTHLAYITGRASAMAGLVVEVRPGEAGAALGSSGFCTNASDPAALFPPLPAGRDLRTSFQDAFAPPASRLEAGAGAGAVVAGAGMPSSYARAVTTVRSLEATGAPALSRLHPTVALLRARRDPYFYDTRTFKITQPARPWVAPRRPSP